MDQASQENELQKAIDDITKNGGAQDNNADVAASLEEQIQNQMGTPPVPPMPPAGDGPAEAMPPMEAEGEVPAEGVAPVEGAEAPALGDAPVDAPAGEPAADGEAPVVPEIPEIPEIPAAEAPAEGEAPAEPALSDDAPAIPEIPSLDDTGANDITTVKEDMLRDLFPIMDQVEMGAEEKYELYKTMLDSNNDKSLIAAAYDVVKGIADEKQRAEALLYLIKKADS